jgi:hypothetical protein
LNLVLAHIEEAGGAAPLSGNKRALLPDRLAANASKALALRMLMRYGDARDLVEFYAGDVSDLPAALSVAEIEKRYLEQMREVISESPETASAELRYLDLVEQIVVEQLAPQEAPVMADEDDLSCGLQLIHWLKGRANARDIDAGIARERAERGDGGDNAA